MTTVLVNDMKTVYDSFYRSLGNGLNSSRDLATIMHSLVASRDTNDFGRLYNRVVLEKKDASGARAMKGVLAAIFPGARMVKDKNDPRRAIFKIADCVPDADALARMDKAVEEKVSLRGDFAARVRGEKPTAPAPFNPVAWAEKMAKAHKNAAELDAMIAALQAQRQKM